MDHSSTRRDFLRRAAAAGMAAPLFGAALSGSSFAGSSSAGSSSAAAPVAVPVAVPGDEDAAQGAGKSLEILMLGGTSFLGPATVDVALARGHKVTLFNRGKTNPTLYPELEKLRGDRDKSELDALAGERKWDVVIDNSGYVPAHVDATAQLLVKRARLYIFISSVSVYKTYSNTADPVDEQGELLTVPAKFLAKTKTIRKSFQHYGGMKALCEQAAEKAMPGRTCNIRPGLIVGPTDRTYRFSYWPIRMDQGGEMLAPGDRDGLVQFIDVRDLGAWIVHCAEQSVTGAYNAVGPLGHLGLGEFLGACKGATTKPTTITWVDEKFLTANGIAPAEAWNFFPMWLPAEGRSRIELDAAVGKGLTFRPVNDTIRDTLAWHHAQQSELTKGRRRRRPGIKPEKEKELLAKWHAAQKEGAAGQRAK